MAEGQALDGSATRRRDRSEDKTKKGMATRRRIMDAAAEAMVERGNTAIQMSEISAMCHMSKGAIYYYFSDKEDLVSAVFDEVSAELLGAIRALHEKGLSPERELVQIGEEFSRRVREGSPLAMALMRELVQAREGVMEASDTSIRRIINLMAELFERTKEMGILRSDLDSHVAAVATCGAFTFCAISANDAGGVTADFGGALLDLLIEGMRGGGTLE